MRQRKTDHTICLRPLTICFLLVLFTATLQPLPVFGQSKKHPEKTAKEAAFYSGRYRNLFRDAGYSQAAIDEKVAKAYHDVFEGPNRVYFEVSDSMAYV